ncbi:jg776 [Pararge aegeria aegeria]|uniref:Jg776 protein n=1 Tax=Pararge aegeria aegeria TaxID=348720 RepID=A0A8S4S8C8_9NEOP|nr:jg776 [Pararge aegeria aegeria]
MVLEIDNWFEFIFIALKVYCDEKPVDKVKLVPFLCQNGLQQMPMETIYPFEVEISPGTRSSVMKERPERDSLSLSLVAPQQPATCLRQVAAIFALTKTWDCSQGYFDTNLQETAAEACDEQHSVVLTESGCHLHQPRAEEAPHENAPPSQGIR